MHIICCRELYGWYRLTRQGLSVHVCGLVLTSPSKRKKGVVYFSRLSREPDRLLWGKSYAERCEGSH